LTGVGTVLADDPQLNVRGTPPLTRGGREGLPLRQPLRVILDSHLRMAPTARILGGGALVYTASADTAKGAALQQKGAEVVQLPGADGQVDLHAVMRDLAQRGCNEVLVEAGRTLNGALLKAGLVDELVLYLAPQLLGDAARGMADLGELTQLQQRVDLQWQDVRQVGGDLRIVAGISKEK
ncbi:MAG: RibD family protein, partial [Gallionellaceae bacterium]|nr:RibD family protein [Gallionellaceae bacterium]